MDIVAWPKKVAEAFKKYKYVAIILLIGLALMAIPDLKSPKQTELVEAKEVESSDMNQQLAQILSHVEGAGEVQVLLTIREGATTLYQTDSNSSVSDTTSTTQVETVLISNASKDDTGLIRQVNPPIFMGAVIVCRGGDIPSVRLAIIDAVSKVTGLGADRISVLKMK